jgi:hypothetical protein
MPEILHFVLCLIVDQSPTDENDIISTDKFFSLMSPKEAAGWTCRRSLWLSIYFHASLETLYTRFLAAVLIGEQKPEGVFNKCFVH